MRPSLQRRLLFLTAGVTALVVGGMAVFVAVRVDRALRADLDQSLRTEALALAGRLEEEDGRVELELGAGDGGEATLPGVPSHAAHSDLLREGGYLGTRVL